MIKDWEGYKENAGKAIIGRLYQASMIKTWYRDKPEGWTLVSGLWSLFYINLRLLPSYPDALQNVGFALGQLILKECPGVDRIVGVAMAGIPISTAITTESQIPSCYTRKMEAVKSVEDFNQRIKDHGEHSLVEGVIESGDRIAIVDDLVTRFDSKEVAIAQFNYELELRGIDAICEDVVVLLDREQGAEESAKKQGITLHSLIPFKSKGIEWLSSVLSRKESTVITDYLRDPEKYQDTNLQDDLRQEAG
ncbi:MAG: hypothetical protein KAS87_01335 [Candidatus Omnitrophica bacterium]|nr:hypothetical protein [Candidatus Omnitrophota bacterium]